MAVKYIGNGSFLPTVPARDMTTQEVKEYAGQLGGEEFLVSTGLYKTVSPKKVVEKSIKESEQ